MSGGFTPDPSWPSFLELAIMRWGEPHSRHGNNVRFGSKDGVSVELDNLVWHDFTAGEGGGYKDTYEAVFGHWPPIAGAKPNGGYQAPPKANGSHAPPQAKQRTGPKVWEDVGPIRYPYHDAAGKLVLEVYRTKSGSPKFGQRRPDHAAFGGWRYKVRDIALADRPLYRLPDLLAAPDAVVWFCEGEKDVENLRSLGLTATTNIGGAGKPWQAPWTEALRGRDVVILPDNDPQAVDKDGQPRWHRDGRPVLPGQDHAALVARKLAGVASRVRVLMLPDLPPKGDVSDWLAAGGTREALEALALKEVPVEPPPSAPPVVEDEPPLGVDDGPPWGGDEPPPPEDPGGRAPRQPDGLPVITVAGGQVPRMVREAQAALAASGLPIYQRGVLVQPLEDEYRSADGSTTHSAMLAPIAPPTLMKLMAESAVWQKWDGRVNGGRGGMVECNVPPDVVAVVLHNRGHWPFPHVRGVLTCPTLRPDGSLLAVAGYDPGSRYFLMFPEGLILPPIPDQPTKADALASLQRLKLLIDSYPFVSLTSRSVALAMLMTQPLRCAMPVSPLLAVSARAPGTGKSHLVDLCSTVAIGRPCPAMGAGKKDEEFEKGLNTMLIAGLPGFSIDNVSRDIDSATLNMATERPLIMIRKFGVLENVEVENAVTIYQTGNNLAIIDEQGRRTIRCELDAGVERPERRHFSGDPIHIARADRGRTIADILTIARAYHVSGETADVAFPLGSYGAWSRFVREPLVWLGEADPADTMEETAKDDPATLRLAGVIAGWHMSFALSPKTLADAVRDAMPEFREVLKQEFPSRGGAEVDTTRMGYWLRRFQKRIANGMRFVKEDGGTHHSNRWYLERV